MMLVQAYDEEELLRLVYYGGVDPSLRKEVWPFLLGHYQFTMSLNERKEVSECDSRRDRDQSRSRVTLLYSL